MKEKEKRTERKFRDIPALKWDVVYPYVNSYSLGNENQKMYFSVPSDSITETVIRGARIVTRKIREVI